MMLHEEIGDIRRVLFGANEGACLCLSPSRMLECVCCKHSRALDFAIDDSGRWLVVGWKSHARMFCCLAAPTLHDDPLPPSDSFSPLGIGTSRHLCEPLLLQSACRPSPFREKTKGEEQRAEATNQATASAGWMPRNCIAIRLDETTTTTPTPTPASSFTLTFTFLSASPRPHFPLPTAHSDVSADCHLLRLHHTSIIHPPKAGPRE